MHPIVLLYGFGYDGLLINVLFLVIFSPQTEDVKEQHTLPPCNTNIKTYKSTPGSNENIHTSERKFQCFTCNERFHSNSSLLKHVLIHTGEKSFQCNTYDEEFRFENSLKKHEIIHMNKTKE